MSELDDQALIRRFVLEHSDEAMRKLIERYSSLVFSVCSRRIGSRELSEDATQSVFLILCRKAPSLLGRTSLAGWLYTCADSVSRNVVRHEANRQKIVATLPIAEPRQPELPSALTPLLDNALNKLSSSDREVIILRFLQGHSFAEIGQIVSVNEDAARMRVQRSLERLRTELARVGLTADTAMLVEVLPSTAQLVPRGLALRLGGLDLSASPTISYQPMTSLIPPIAVSTGVAALVVGGFALGPRSKTSAQPLIALKSEIAAGAPTGSKRQADPATQLSPSADAQKGLDGLVQTFTGTWTLDTRIEGFGRQTIQDDGAKVQVNFDPAKKKLNIKGEESEARKILPRYMWDLDPQTGTLEVIPGGGNSHYRSTKVKDGATILNFSFSTKGAEGALTVSYGPNKVIFELSVSMSIDAQTGQSLTKPVPGKSTWTFHRSQA